MPPRDPEPRVHRGATWNLRKGRDADVVALEVDAFLTEHDLDWIVVQEAADYVRTLGKQLRGRYDVHTGWSSRSRRDSAVIVRAGLPSRFKRVHALERTGWERDPDNRRFGLHNHRSMVSVRVGRKGFRYRLGSVHLPPGPHDAPGYPLRGRAFRRSLRTLRRLARRWSDAKGLDGWAMVGDWNERPDSAPIREFLYDTDGGVIGNRIDYPVTHGVIANRYRRVAFGSSDHKPVLVWVRLP